MTENDTSEFEAELTDKGYEIATKSMDPSIELDNHNHDFGAWGLGPGHDQ